MRRFSEQLTITLGKSEHICFPKAEPHSDDFLTWRSNRRTFGVVGVTLGHRPDGELAGMHSQPEHVDLSMAEPIRAFLQSVRRCGMHFHGAVEFLLVLQGRLGLRIDHTTRHLGAGDVALVLGNQFHETFALNAPNLVVAVQIDPLMFERLDPEFRNRQFAFNDLAAARPDAPCITAIRALIATTIWETQLKRPAWRVQAEAAVLQILTLLLREVPYTVEARRLSIFEFEEDGALGPRLQRIVDFIYDNVEENLSLADMAWREGVSTEYLSRLFKARTDYTFKTFVTEVRLRRSLDMLVNPDRRIIDVAMAGGFPNLKAYNAAFLRTFHCTPSQWRTNGPGAVNGEADADQSPYLPVDEHAALALVRRYLTDPQSA